MKWPLIICLVVVLCGCMKAENGQGMVLSPAGEATVAAATSLWVPLEFRPLVWLLGAILSGGYIRGKMKK